MIIYHNFKNLFQPFQQIYASNKEIRLNIIFLESTLFCSNQNTRLVEYFKLNENVNRYELLNKLVNKFPIQQIYGSFNRILILSSNNKYYQYIYNKKKDNFEKGELSKEKGSILSQIEFLDEGNSFLELSYQGDIKLWRFINQELQIIKVVKLQQHITSASVSKNKNTLIIGLADGTIKVLI
ncbi:unnamed protein product [Paramecium sonneborni]|uniref:Uncharacterized protein n=1 Tax=Paramecium sonneborni TaxID=65129 RepID=A0A8S1JV88_9CILI|nr:unnamed protein product [Paramecium sonneborni]CAD8046351.1 unnamed protein product [Paramecium sonneborni]